MSVCKHVKPTVQNRTPDDMKLYRRKRIKLDPREDRPVSKHKGVENSGEDQSGLFEMIPSTNTVVDSGFEATICNVYLRFDLEVNVFRVSRLFIGFQNMRSCKTICRAYSLLSDCDLN